MKTLENAKKRIKGKKTMTGKAKEKELEPIETELTILRARITMFL
jgi:hypothetical protein